MLAIAIVFVDQLTKHIFFVERSFGPEWLSSLLRLTQHKNTGIGFDLPLPTPLIITVSILLIAVLLWILAFWYRRHERSVMLSGSMILGGAVGNFFDRVAYGYVRDWLLIGNRSVINFSDLAIIFGTLWIFFSLEHVGHYFCITKSKEDCLISRPSGASPRKILNVFQYISNFFGLQHPKSHRNEKVMPKEKNRH